MTTLLQRMHDELVRRNYAATTIRTYLHALRTCERYHRGRRLDQLGATALRRYHAHLFREGSSPSGPWDSTWRPCDSSLSGCLSVAH